MKRSVTVKLQPSKEQEEILFELAYASAIIWNKLNYQRLKQFKEFGKIDFNGTEKRLTTFSKTGLAARQSNN